MKLSRIIFALGACGILSLRADQLAVDGVTAVVSARAVAYTEVQDFSQPAAELLRRQYPAQPEVFRQKLIAAQNDSLQQLVERQLILHSFEVEGYKLPESVVDEAVQERIRERFGDRVTFMKTLQAQGMTVEQFRKQIRDQYIESALRNQNIAREIFVSPHKVEKYYAAHPDEFRLEEQIKLRIIVLTNATPDHTATLKRAHEILAMIKGGAAFADLASTYSEGSQQRQGGDWGWVERSVPRKEIADIAFALEPGKVSDVLDLSDGCYLMLVEEKRSAHVRPLAEVALDIERKLRLQEQARLQRQWIDSLKRKTFVRYYVQTQ